MSETIDTRTDRDFYVTVQDAGRTGFLLGPYSTHQEALNNVARGKALAEMANSRAVFYAYGTSSLPEGTPNVPVVFAMSQKKAAAEYGRLATSI